MIDSNQENLIELAARLQGVIETAIDGIITINENGIVESINTAGAKIFGYRPENVIGHNVTKLMPEPYHSQHDGYLRRYQSTKEKRIIGIGREVQGLKKSGEIFPFRLAVGEVILNNRVIYTGIIHDLSDIKAVQQKLLDANEALEHKVNERTREIEMVVNRLLESNRLLEEREQELNQALTKERELGELKTRFVTMASHEFRTPLSTILSSVALISRYKQSDEQQNREKHIGRIKSAVATLTGILNDFLSLGKLEEGIVEVNLESVLPTTICNQVLDEIQGLLKTGQQILHHSESDEGEIMTDLRILKNILFNLISNAIKYSPENSTIHCRLRTEKGQVAFDIEDNGIGIPEAEQKHLFSRFFRASNVENIQGTGLGLQIVKRYVELLGGEISFSSEQGKGSTFTFTIPQNGT